MLFENFCDTIDNINKVSVNVGLDGYDKLHKQLYKLYNGVYSEEEKKVVENPAIVDAFASMSSRDDIFGLLNINKVEFEFHDETNSILFFLKDKEEKTHRCSITFIADADVHHWDFATKMIYVMVNNPDLFNSKMYSNPEYRIRLFKKFVALSMMLA